MKFVKPTESLKLKTNKGELEILAREYFILDDERGNSNNLMINKSGVQKIEDHFEIDAKVPTIQQTFHAVNNFNIIVTVEITSKYGSSYGVASANPLNLGNTIAMMYGTEMGVKRARATAALELLRKNYIGEKALPLLYSSFDEFKSEDSVNSGSVNRENANKAENTKPNNSMEQVQGNTQGNTQGNSENWNEFVIRIKNYENGVTLPELEKQNLNYLKWLCNKPNRYRDKVRLYAQEKNIDIA